MLELIGKLITGTPWAITSEMLIEISRIYDDHRAGKAPDIKAIEAQLGRPLANEQKPYVVIDGIASISISGVIAKRMNLFMEISGGASIEKITADFKTALADPSVRAILLVIDSPGGQVDGVFELADIIHNARDVKPVISLAYGTMASAAYLIGSAASAVYASDIAAIVGSIGVVAVHRDTSQQDAKSGVVTTEIYRGKYKRIVTSGPLTEEGRMNMEEKVDYYYSLFINEIARFRGMTPETVLSKMSTDVTDFFIGQQAVDAGLIDGIAPFDKAINLARSMTGSGIQKSGGITASGKEKRMSETTITTIEQLAAAYPELMAAAREQAVKGVDLEGPRTQAAESERTRILGLAEVHFGKELSDKFSALVKTGVTIEQYAAFKAANPTTAPAQSAEDTAKAAILAGLKETGAADVGTDTAKAAANKDYMTLVEEHMAVHNIPKLKAMQAVIAKYPAKHDAYIAEANKTRRPAHV
jgi:signal peptide peptidase SppA